MEGFVKQLTHTKCSTNVTAIVIIIMTITKKNTRELSHTSTKERKSGRQVKFNLKMFTEFLPSYILYNTGKLLREIFTKEF